MELIDENPDCMETMSLVAEDLLAKFNTVQDGWVILVGRLKIVQALDEHQEAVQHSFEKATFPWRLTHNEKLPNGFTESVL